MEAQLSGEHSRDNEGGGIKALRGKTIRGRLLPLILALLLMSTLFPLSALAPASATTTLPGNQSVPSAPAGKVTATTDSGTTTVTSTAPGTKSGTTVDQAASSSAPVASPAPTATQPVTDAPASAPVAPLVDAPASAPVAPLPLVQETPDLPACTPSIKIIKDGPAVAAPGDNIVYNFTVKNTGNGGANLTNVTVNDPMLGGLIKSYASILEGNQETFTHNYTVPADAPGTIDNTATATGHYGTQTVTSSDNHSVRIKQPGITIIKSAPDSACVGELVTYKFKVTNTGELDLTNVKVTDDKLGDIGTAASLAVGAYVEFEKSYTILVTDADPLVNNVTVTGTTSCGKQVTGSARHSLDILIPGISLTKKASTDCARVGDTITYNFVVKNTGDVVLYWPNVTDPMLGDPAAAYVIWGAPTLAVGESVPFSKTYVVKDTDPSPLCNTATVIAGVGLIPCLSGTVTATASASVDIEHPSITLVKSANVDCAREGDTITYSFKVKNTGDVDLTNVTVTDSMLTVPSFGTLTPQQEVTQTVDYVVPPNTPGGPLVNNATVTGTPPCGPDVTAKGSASVDIEHPSITLVKSANVDCAREGDTITYSFKVKNTGDVDLTNVTVTDSMLTVPSFGTLTPQQEVTQTVDYVVPPNTPGGPLVNNATVTGTPPCGPDVTATASASVDIEHPSITITKTGPASAAVGDTITYSYLVKNTGDVKLTGITVNDNKLGDIGPFNDLDPGAEQTVTKDYTVVVSDSPAITNTATVTGTPPCGPDVTDTSKWTVEITGGIPVGAIEITKVNSTGSTVTEGDPVSFTITVKNTGQTVIEAPVKLTDTFDPTFLTFETANPVPDVVTSNMLTWNDVSGGSGLAIGASVSVDVTFLTNQLEGQTVNSATVSAKDSNGATLEGTATASVTIVEAVVPTVPQPTTTVSNEEAAETVSGTLPRTGDQLNIFFILAWILIPLGLLLMTSALILRRRRLTRVSQ